MSDILVWGITRVLAKRLIDAAFDYLQHIPSEERDESIVEQGTPPNDTTHEITPVFGKYITRNAGFARELSRIRVIVKDYAISMDLPKNWTGE